MKQTFFEAQLRMPDYWSEGFIMITEHNEIKEVKGLFTIDPVEGELKKGRMELLIQKRSMDTKRMVPFIEGICININLGEELNCPETYSFNSEYDNYELRLTSLIENAFEINEMQKLLSRFQ